MRRVGRRDIGAKRSDVGNRDICPGNRADKPAHHDAIIAGKISLTRRPLSPASCQSIERNINCSNNKPLRARGNIWKRASPARRCSGGNKMLALSEWLATRKVTNFDERADRYSEPRGYLRGQEPQITVQTMSPHGAQA